ncbi:hypothetical protein SAMN02983003_3854 [Devosia enhydra]|uniref:Uncharacterized protein n=1 Tax=Devosia enhydra TaxID=665118 RepID=A0A1K2I2R1_9HYPH|nr:hypothetical protein [Devosia enhydra]SFZ86661.1 hypothetical protein SAMN02983003_3854 [Devosia enhydra]
MRQEISSNRADFARCMVAPDNRSTRAKVRKFARLNDLLWHVVAYLAVLAFASAEAAHAQMSDQMSGIGTWACADFIQNVGETDVQIAAHGFVIGFVSGLNVAQIVDGKPYYSLQGVGMLESLAPVLEFCRSNPRQPLIAGADALLLTLSKKMAR